MRALIALMLLLFPIQDAQASFWLECKVHAQVRRNLDTGLYKAEIKGAVVTDGHADKGAKCLENKIGQTLNLKITGSPPEGKTVRLKYKMINSATSDGVVNEESWQYWPLGIKDLGPW